MQSNSRITIQVLVGASSGSTLWAWMIDTSSNATLASPEERILSPAINDAEFVDAVNAGAREIAISWVDESNDEYCLGLLDLAADDDLSYERVSCEGAADLRLQLELHIDDNFSGLIL